MMQEQKDLVEEAFASLDVLSVCFYLIQSYNLTFPPYSPLILPSFTSYSPLLSPLISPSFSPLIHPPFTGIPKGKRKSHKRREQRKR